MQGKAGAIRGGRLGRLWFWLPAILATGIDQLTKVWAAAATGQDPDSLIPVIPGFFSLQWRTNTGALWGLFQGHGPALIALSLLAIGVIIYFLITNPELRRFGQVCLGLIFAGAVGNLIDRIGFGCVRDFLLFQVNGFAWPNFNVADAALTVGCLGLAWCFLTEKKSRREANR